MTCNIYSSTLFLLSLSLIHLFLFSVFIAFHISSFFHSPCSHSIYHCLTALRFDTSPPLLSTIAYVANQDKFPLRTLNVIGGFQTSSQMLLSPSICCPHPKSDMGFMERVHTTENTITACSSHLPSFFSPYPKQQGTHETCSPLTLEYFSSPLSHFHHPCFCFPLSPVYFIFPPHLSCFMLSPLLSPLQCLSFFAIYISLPDAQR